MTAVYRESDLSFAYPENWQLSDQRDADSPHQVTVESPSGAFWSVHRHPPTSPDKLAPEVLLSFREDYPDLEFETVEEQLAGVAVTGYELHFFYLDFLIRAKVRFIALSDRTLVVFSQAEDREFSELAPVFLAITTSLLMSLDSLPE